MSKPPKSLGTSKALGLGLQAALATGAAQAPVFMGMHGNDVHHAASKGPVEETSYRGQVRQPGEMACLLVGPWCLTLWVGQC